MGEQNLFSRTHLRVINTLGKVLANDENNYALNMDKYSIKVQGTYKANLVRYCIDKKWKQTISQNGYIYLEKDIAGLKVSFCLTD